MKMNDILNTVKCSANRAVFSARKHSPEILVIGGVVGMVATVFTACKATTKLSGILEDAQTNIDAIHEAEEHPEELKEEYTKEDARKDLALTYFQTGVKVAKLYGPSILLGAASATSILAGHNILRKRTAALTAAYTALNSSFANYRNNLREQYGAEVDHALMAGIKATEDKKTVTDPETGERKEVTTTTTSKTTYNGHSQYARIFDELNTYYKKDAEYNMMFLRQQQFWANQKLVSEGHLFLNDVYKALGFQPTKMGQAVGWIYDPNRAGEEQVNFGLWDVSKQEIRDFINGDERAVWLDFNVDGCITYIFQ